MGEKADRGSKRSPEEAERIPGLHVYRVNCLSCVEVRARLSGFRSDNGDVPGMRFASSGLRLLETRLDIASQAMPCQAASGVWVAAPYPNKCSVRSTRVLHPSIQAFGAITIAPYAGSNIKFNREFPRVSSSGIAIKIQ